MGVVPEQPLLAVVHFEFMKFEWRSSLWGAGPDYRQ
jgi:hypothetical protein